MLFHFKRKNTAILVEKNQNLLFLFAIKMSNVRIHMAQSELKKTQVPNSQTTKKKKSIKMTIWGELADLIFLWAYRLLHIFLPNSTLRPWKCISMFCYVHLLLNINGGRCNYAQGMNTTKDILCCILFNLNFLSF